MTASGTECSSLTPLLTNSGVTGKQQIMTTDMADFQDVSISFIHLLLRSSKRIACVAIKRVVIPLFTFYYDE